MTSRGASGPLELQFTIDDRPGVLRAADIAAVLGLHILPANSEGYRAWAQHIGPRHHSGASALQEAAPASDAAD